ncbi:hypothetical protein GCM10025873_08530 [Demequina sediminis]|uniref:hypothetical protein n=1 Tax=Demequina sediminis TaxID=1930058 RepID=UPI00257243E1|nr:hypothetical protein [Demequina sediminis]BDZ61062.1 hypothetical protein GCM10025873_08530 [Demequina sediminis]
MSIVEKAYTSPLGRKVAAKAGLAEPPRLRRGRTYPQGAVVLAAPSGATLVEETLRLIGRAYEQPVVDVESAAGAPRARRATAPGSAPSSWTRRD